MHYTASTSGGHRSPYRRSRSPLSVSAHRRSKATDGSRDDFEDIAHQMAEQQDSDHYPTRCQEQITATLLEASFRLGECHRRRLQIDLLDIATRVISSDAYAHPWGELIFKPDAPED